MDENISFSDQLVALARSEPPTGTAPISAYITNLGKYVEGALVGKWHDFPTTKEEIQRMFKEIGVDGIRYEEFFITDYDVSISGLYDCLGEYENLDALNYLASLIDGLDEHEVEKLEAVLEFGEYTGSVKDLINLTQNLDNYDLYPSVSSEEDYGYYLIEDCRALEIPESVRPYFDYEAFGRDCSLDESSMFTDNGYVLNNGGSFIEHYGGREDLPKESRVTAYPRPDNPKQKHRQPEKEEQGFDR